MPTASHLRTELIGFVRGLDAETLAPEAAMALVQELAAIEKAAATGRMFAAARVARSDAWRGQGHATAADWLAAQAGISVREAATQLGTAKRAAKLPDTERAMRDGRLSPTQADAVTDGATADPSAERSLLDSAANDTTAALRDKAAKARAAATDSATRERRIHARRSVRTRTDREGAFHLHLEGPAADGARLLARLRPFEEQAFRTARAARADGVRDTFDNRTYDAFLALLGLRPTDPSTAGSASEPPSPAQADSDGDGSPSGAEAAAAPDAGAAPVAPVPTAGGDNVKVIVRIDHTALLRGHTVAGETCDIPGLGPISVTAARDLMQDAFLAAVITRGRDVCTVAHLGRSLSAFQRTAIEALGLRCTNRACNRTVAIQIDHRTPWAEVHETKLDNQDPLCPNCHRLKTHHGWTLEPGSGPRRFVPPGGPPGPDEPPRGTSGADRQTRAPASAPAPSGGTATGGRLGDRRRPNGAAPGTRRPPPGPRPTRSSGRAPVDAGGTASARPTPADRP